MAGVIFYTLPARILNGLPGLLVDGYTAHEVPPTEPPVFAVKCFVVTFKQSKIRFVEISNEEYNFRVPAGSALILITPVYRKNPLTWKRGARDCQQFIEEHRFLGLRELTAEEYTQGD